MLRFSRAIAVATLLGGVARAAIDWGTCTDETLTSVYEFDCGSVTVPKDYTNEAAGTFDLQLVRIPALQQPSLGTILINYGGPGSEGRYGLLATAQTLIELSGRRYDLAIFDPRGTGVTIPFTCFTRDQDYTHIENELTPSSDSSDTALSRQFYVADNYAAHCSANAAEVAPLVNTAFVARDLMEVVDALDEGGKLNFWGFSYGTTLGATVASMFPDRMNKLVLDAVQNPHEYYHAAADYEEWTNSEEVWHAIFEHCIENADRCSLASRSSDPVELEAMVWEAFQDLKFHPIPVRTWLLDYTTAVIVFGVSLYTTSWWPWVTKFMDLMLDGSSEELAEVASLFLAAKGSYEPFMGIHCVDRSFRSDSWEELEPIAETLMETKIIGSATPLFTFVCAKWPYEAAERYDGDFQVETHKPMLIVTNTGDSHTPPESARNISSGFTNSRVLTVDGYGHSTLALPSRCSWRNIQSYWLNGTLPDEDTTCDNDAPPWSGKLWTDLFTSGPGAARAGGDDEVTVAQELTKLFRRII